jgi:hypothetical protein
VFWKAEFTDVAAFNLPNVTSADREKNFEMNLYCKTSALFMYSSTFKTKNSVLFQYRKDFKI